jgi:hypothetical protein
MPFTDTQIAEALEAIHAEEDPAAKNFRVASLLSELFREIGTDPIVVGGSAVEFYTEGGYVSGDIDLCFAGATLPSPVQRAEIMLRLGAEPLGIRKFKLANVYVDLLGAVETIARTPFGQIGSVKLMPIEDLVAERVFAATAYPGFGPEQEAVAKVLLAAVLNGSMEVDYEEMRRLAASPQYEVGPALERMLSEIMEQVQTPQPMAPRMSQRSR